MAKKKQGSPSTGLIIVLIFFVLGTFGAGTMAYFGYSEQEQFKADAKKAKDSQTAAEAQFREERARRVIYRIAMGVDDATDRLTLVQEIENFRPQMKEEYDRILRSLDNKEVSVYTPDPMAAGKFIEKKEKVPPLTWKLLNMTPTEIAGLQRQADQSGGKVEEQPDVRPVRTLPEMIAEANEREKIAKSEAMNALAKAAAATTLAEENKVKNVNLDDKFKSDLEILKKAQKDKFDDIETRYQKLVKDHKADAQKAIDEVAKIGKADTQKAEDLAQLGDKLKQLLLKLDKLETASSTASGRAAGVDFVNLEEKKGEIIRKEEGGFVTINIGASKKLKPQITFLVVASNISWLALLEKEEALKRSSRTNDRQPFEDNPYVKAGIEVVEITGPESSRAKVIFENSPIRDPIQPRDQIFNLAWKPDEEIRIAFAGIIDTDGDGIDNNEDFLRLLERQGVVVDEYLKLKPLDFVKRDGKGMSLRTKYLVISEHPKLDSLPTDKDTRQTLQIKAIQEKFSDIKKRASELGVQMIDSRKFLAMIGYKMPKNPAPPAYGSSVYLDGAEPAPVEPKKGN